jgi:hypothetical protein
MKEEEEMGRDHLSCYKLNSTDKFIDGFNWRV